MSPKINLKFLMLSALLAGTTIAKKAKIYSNCLKPGQFVLTFDDGPNPETTPVALEVLEKYNIKATFFINAHNWSDLDNDPEAVEMVKKTYKAGHDIGSHTYNHKDLFTAIEDDTLKENIDDMTDKIESIIGVRPAYFRPPCGNGAYEESDPVKKEMSDLIQEYLGERGYSIIMWGTDTRDWQYKEDVDKVIETLNEQLASPGVSPKTNSYITLLHDVHATTVNIVLPAVIEYIQSLGYTFVSLSECIGVSPYQSIANDDDNKSNLNNDNDDDDNKNSSSSGSSSGSSSSSSNSENTSSSNGSNSSGSSGSSTTETGKNYTSSTGTSTKINNDIIYSNSTTSEDDDNGVPINKITNNIKDTSSDATTLQYSMIFTAIAFVLSYLL